MSTSRIADTPVTADDVDEALEFFTGIMRFKMLKNLHKGHWLDLKITAPYLVARLREEFVELQEAIRDISGVSEGIERAIAAGDADIARDTRAFSGEKAAAIASECADVANFAMMLADYFRVCHTCMEHKFTGRHMTECSNAPSQPLP